MTRTVRTEPEMTDCPLCAEGPKGKAICDFRRGCSVMDLMGCVMKDDQDRWRCLTCLDVVPDERVFEGAIGYKCRSGPYRTGYEAVCCGSTK